MDMLLCGLFVLQKFQNFQTYGERQRLQQRPTYVCNKPYIPLTPIRRLLTSAQHLLSLSLGSPLGRAWAPLHYLYLHLFIYHLKVNWSRYNTSSPNVSPPNISSSRRIFSYITWISLSHPRNLTLINNVMAYTIHIQMSQSSETSPRIMQYA